MVISECNFHDKVAVHLFIKLFILLYYISNSRAVQKLQELSEFVSPPTRFWSKCWVTLLHHKPWKRPLRWSWRNGEENGCKSQLAKAFRPADPHTSRTVHLLPGRNQEHQVCLLNKCWSWSRGWTPERKARNGHYNLWDSKAPLFWTMLPGFLNRKGIFKWHRYSQQKSCKPRCNNAWKGYSSYVTVYYEGNWFVRYVLEKMLRR